MAWDGGGTFNRVHNFSADASAGIQAQASRFDAEFDGLKTGLENTATLTGETSPTANQPMGGFRHTGVGAGLSADNYLRVNEFINNTPIFISAISVNATTSFSASAPLYSVNPVNGTTWYLGFDSASTLGLSPSISHTASVNPTYLKMNGLSHRVVDRNGENLLHGQLHGRDPKVVIFHASTSAYILQNPAVGSCYANCSITPYLAGASATVLSNKPNFQVNRVDGGIWMQCVTDLGNTALSAPISGLSLATSADELRIELPEPFAGTWRGSDNVYAVNDGLAAGIPIRKLGTLNVASANATYASFRFFNGGAFSTTGTASVGIPMIPFFLPRNTSLI
jgi:hypothetical protein